LQIGGSAIVQGYGDASASAGTHKPVGAVGGQPFGHCIDLSPNEVPFTRGAFDNLVAKGFAPFPRTNWPGGNHWHLVDSTRPVADAGNNADGTGPDHRESVNQQLAEWVRGGDGLVGDLPMPAAWRPTLEQRAFVRKVWLAGKLPDDGHDTKTVKAVRYPSGPVLATYEMVEGGDHIADQGKVYVR